MQLSRFCVFCAVLVSSTLSIIPAANAAKDAPPASPYAAMCMQSVNMPAPYGEFDLKGNHKLAEYCSCFDKKFSANAMRALRQSGSQPLGETTDEQLAIRNSCRKQLGMPLVQDANLAQK